MSASPPPDMSIAPALAAIRTEIQLEILRGVYGLAMHLGHEMTQILGHRRDQFEIYALTALARSGPLKQARLAQIIGRSSVFTSRLVGQLERDGLAKRVEHPFDRRIRRVSLTPAGREAYKRMKLRSVELASALFQELSNERLAELAHAMRSLSAQKGFQIDMDFRD